MSRRKKSGVPAFARELLKMQEFEQLSDAKKRDSRVTVPFLVHRKRFELLAFGSVDRRYIQLS